MFKKLLWFILKLSILFFLFSGIVDFSLFMKKQFSSVLLNKNQWLTSPSLKEEVPVTHLSGVSTVSKPRSTPQMHIAADGRRGLPPQDPGLIKHRYLIVGASQAFGYYATDDILFSTLLQDRQPTWEILNYATPGENLNTMRKRLDYVLHNVSGIERVIALAGSLDLYPLCLNTDSEVQISGDMLSFQRLYYRIKFRFIENLSPVGTCSDPETAQLAARGVYEDMISFLNTADKLGVEAQIILPPTYLTHPSNLQRIAGNSALLDRNNAYVKPSLALRSLIANGNERRIIDLSTSFDDIEAPYFDKMSHFNVIGHKTMADALETILQRPVNED